MSKMFEFTKKVWGSFRYFLRDIYYQFMLVFFPGKFVYDFFSARWKDYPIGAPQVAGGAVWKGPRRAVVAKTYGGGLYPPESAEAEMTATVISRLKEQGITIDVV